MTIMFKYTIGEEVKDITSGLTGIIDGASIWTSGVIKYSVQPKVEEGKNVKPVSYWVDEDLIEKISDGVANILKF